MKKFTKLLIAVALVAVLAFGLVACGEKPEAPAAMSVSASSASFTQVGAQSTIVAKLGEVEAVAVWASDDEEVATVSNGVITAVGNGAAVVTATIGEQSKEVAVTVDAEWEFAVDASYIEFAAAEETQQLEVTVGAPNVYFSEDVMYYSSNTDVVKVSDAGLVTAVGKGAAKITVETAHREYSPASSFMGRTSPASVDAAASATINVVVGNEFDSVAQAAIVGVYSDAHAWKGVARMGSTDEGWLKAEAKMELNADGTYMFMATTLQRAKATDKHPYNNVAAPAGTVSADDAAAYGAVEGEAWLEVPAFAMSNFGSKGYWYVMDGQVHFTNASATFAVDAAGVVDTSAPVVLSQWNAMYMSVSACNSFTISKVVAE